MSHKPSIAVLIPCWNEALSIGKVVSEFKAVLPYAKVYVFDNNSTDQTIYNAQQAGAEVFSVPLQGKGNVVRRMFADINAEIYVLVDGDDTYDPQSAISMIDSLHQENLDMVVGRRVARSDNSYRPGHRLGNILLTQSVSYLFGDFFKDMLSGYRVFSRRFVKSFPASSSGFEIETELTIHALDLKMSVKEIDTPYAVRMVGSLSKLRTFHDGFRILLTIIKLFRHLRPKNFYGLIGMVFAFVALILAIPLFITYFQDGLVPRFPTAILVSAMMVVSCVCFFCGIILNAVSASRRDFKYLTYLNVPDRS